LVELGKCFLWMLRLVGRRVAWVRCSRPYFGRRFVDLVGRWGLPILADLWLVRRFGYKPESYRNFIKV
jgi:hypothetical protein